MVLEKNEKVGTEIVKIAKIRGAPPASFAYHGARNARRLSARSLTPSCRARCTTSVVRAVRPRILIPRARRLSTCISRDMASVVGLPCAVVALRGHKRGHFGKKVV